MGRFGSALETEDNAPAVKSSGTARSSAFMVSGGVESSMEQHDRHSIFVPPTSLRYPAAGVEESPEVLYG